MSFNQVEALARDLKMDYVVAKRQPGAKVIVPSVVNWKAEHYAALVKEEDGRYLVQDPTFGDDIWVSRAALDAEATGYFLVPRARLPSGWQLASAKEASKVWGRGNTGSHDTSGTKPYDEKAKDCASSGGMAVYNFHLQTVSLNITDTPVGYVPPRGPAMRFTATYNQREASQPAIFTYSNLGPKWTFDWLSYIQDDSNNPSADATLYVSGGGSERYQNFNANTGRFATQFQSRAILRRVSWSPIVYERTQSDGSREIFAQSNRAAGTSRKVFLTQRIDPAGNAAQFSYDDTLRLTTVTDDLNQQTIVSYDLQGDLQKITKVTDPFGRYASFGYTAGLLTSITDTIGIVSQFAYAPGSDFIQTLTTPYGSTTFTQPASSLYGQARVIQATDPTGAIERVEYGHDAPGISGTQADVPPNLGLTNAYYNYRNSFYWDKRAMAMYPPDANTGVPQFTKAKLTQWLHTADGQSAANIKQREKQALENAVYYQYPSQSTSYSVGSSGRPTKVSRRLADGSTQLYQSEHNSLGNITKATDPRGRVTSYAYDSNDVDLLRVYQRNPQGASTDPGGAAADKIASYTYDGQHKPLTATDAAGQTTTYTYNPYGQLETATNAKQETTTYAYGGSVPNGYLASITSPPFNGASAVTSFTYDGARRVRTVTSSPDNYTTTTDYDNLDRPTKVTYSSSANPDTTFEEFKYTDNNTGVMKLDLTGTRDRRGRWTYRHYNANRQMDSITDPLGRTTSYDWCNCGSLNGFTDARGKTTTFHRDVQGRVYQKVFADNTAINHLYEGQSAPNTPGATSRLKSLTDAAYQTTNYEYFADDNLKQLSYAGAATPTATFTYDPHYNRRATMTDGIGTTSYGYYPVANPPALGAARLGSEDGPLPNDTITYGYDELGRTTSHAINGVGASGWYDSLGRAGTSSNALGTFSRGYHGVTGRLQTLSYPNGQSATYGYFDNAGDRRLQTIQNVGPGATNLSTFGYTYDVEGQIQTWSTNGLTDTYGYDLADQLTSVTPSGWLGAHAYGYDAGGNRTSDDRGPHSFNDVNQRTDPGYMYNLNGNLKSDGWLNYQWDAASRMRVVEQTLPGGGGGGESLAGASFTSSEPAPGKEKKEKKPRKIKRGRISDAEVAAFYEPFPGTLFTYTRSEFSYDGLGRRVRIVEKQDVRAQDDTSPPNWVEVSDRRYLWVGDTLAEERDASGGSVTKRYFGEGEQIGGTNYYFSRDHLGSVREMTDAGGGLIRQYSYDPYGSSGGGIQALDSDFGFTGHYYHAPSGLYLTRYRAYDSGIGRWLSRDPIGEKGGPNLYGYVRNNPINLVDPLGLRDYSAAESRKILDAVRADAKAGPVSGFFNILANHTSGLFYQGHADFKLHDSQDNIFDDTYCVEGVRYQSDQFGNFAAGYAGEHYAGSTGVALMKFGGVAYDFVDVFRPSYNPLNLDADSRPDINAGANLARRERVPPQ